jgi:hypothetical protein
MDGLATNTFGTRRAKLRGSATVRLRSMKRAKLVLIAIGGIILVETAYAFVLWCAMGRPESVGIFGDMFGALNTFFAGLAFTGLIYTIYLQIKESADAREESATAQRLVQQQVAALEEGLKRQHRRDRVEAGPFFKFVGGSSSGGVLKLQVSNVGAPVICLDFKCTTPGCAVSANQWYPSALATGDVFTAPTNVPSNVPATINYEMKLVDRWREERTFALAHFSTYGGQINFREL